MIDFLPSHVRRVLVLSKLFIRNGKRAFFGSKKSSLFSYGFLTLTVLFLINPLRLLPNGPHIHLTPPIHHGGHVLGAETGPFPGFLGKIIFNVPGEFGQDVSLAKTLTVSGDAIFNGRVIIRGHDLSLGSGTLTASNLLYGIVAGSGISVSSSSAQTPIITNTGVLSVQGETGDVVLTAGAGISITGTTITNTNLASTPNAFENISAGGSTITAGSSTDTLTFAAGTGISFSTDTTNKILTINGTSGVVNLSGSGITGILPLANGGTNNDLTANAGAVVYSNATQLALTAVGLPGQCLLSQGSSAPIWGSCATGAGSYWQLNSGVVSPLNITNDLAIGGTTTSSAKFQVSGTTGNIAATGTLTGLTGLTSSGTIQFSSLSTGIAHFNGSGVLSSSPVNLASEVTGVLPIANGGTGNGLSAVPGGVLYSTASQLALTPAGANGQCLLSQGASAPSWGSCTSGIPSFWQLNNAVLSPLNITNDLAIGGTATSSALFQVSGTTGNITAAGALDITGNIVGVSSPSLSGFGTIDGLALTANATGFSISGGTTSKILSVNNTLIFSGTDGTTLTFPGISDTIAGISATQTLTNKTIAAGSNTITGLTNANLSGSAGITNANLANSTITITAGTGLSGGGTVALGGSTTLTNTGVTSLTGTTNQVNVSGSTGGVTLSLPQNINAGASPTFSGLRLSSFGIGVVQSDGSGNLSSSPLSLAGVLGVLPVVNGGTGDSNLPLNGVVYGNGTGSALTTATGSAGQVLSVNGSGAPIWENLTVSGGSGGNCSNCLINNPTSTQTIFPTNNSTGLSIAQTTTGSPSVDIFNVTNSAGSTKYIEVDQNGNISLTGNITATGTLTGLTGLTSSGTIQFSSLSTGIAHFNGSGVLSSSAVNLASSDVTGILPVANGGTGANITAVAGAIAYSTASQIALTGVGTTGQCLLSQGASTPTWGSCTGGVVNYWQLNSGVVSPLNITNDLAVGGTTTSSAKFQVSGTTGNIAATGTLTGLTGLTSSGTIQFSSLSTGIAHFNGSGVLSSSAVNLASSDVTGILPVANGGTGDNNIPLNEIMYGNGTSGVLTVATGSAGQILSVNGSNVPIWQTLSVSGGSGGNCTNCLVTNPTVTQTINPTGATTTGLSVAQTSTGSPSVDIFNVTNSAGSNKFLEVDQNGNVTIGTSSANTLTVNSGLASNLIPNATDLINLGSSGLEYNNLYVKNIISPSLSAGIWQSNLGVIAPTNITNDLAIGGIATSSAKFQVSGTTGNITATGTLTGLTGLTSSGTIQFSSLSTGIAHFNGSGVLSSSAVNLASSDVTGILPVANGGTGDNTLLQNGVLYGTGSGAIQTTASGAAGQVLEANILGIPTWQNLTVSGGTGGTCSNCIVTNPTTSQTINPTGNITGLSIAQTTTGSPSADIFDVTNSSGSVKYLQIDNNGNTNLGGTETFTNAATTTIGESIQQNWTMNSNTFNYRRSITITDGDSLTPLAVDYEVFATVSGAIAADLCTNSQANNDDLRISYGPNSEIARIVSRSCSTSVTISFYLVSAINPGNSDTYYIYYDNPNLITSGPTYSDTSTAIDNADNVANFVTSDPTYTPISQDTVIKEQGTGSVLASVSGGITGINFTTSTATDGAFDLSQGGGVGGCNEPTMSWNAGTSTCTINNYLKSVYNFSTINIPVGDTVTFIATAAGTSIPTFLATGNATIAGTINVNALGYNQTGPGGGLGGGCCGGDSGGSYGGQGTQGSGPGPGNTYTGFNFGSGGGPFFSNPNGGLGGGAIQITTPATLNVSGSITAVGGNGTGCTGASCSGGGSGGGIDLQAGTMIITGTVTAQGGGGSVFDGGNYGGNGGGGRLFLDWLSSISTGSGTFTLTGGTNGHAQQGSVGVSATRKASTSINQTIITTKSATDLSTQGAVCFWVRQDTAGQFFQFGFGKTSITEQTYTFTINSINTWTEECLDIGGLSTSARQNITVFGFTVTNVGGQNANIWIDNIFSQSNAGFFGINPTLAEGGTLLGTNNLTLNAQGLGGVLLNYDPTNALGGTGGMTLYNGGSTPIFAVDSSGNASAGGTFNFIGTSNDFINVLNGAAFNIQTSPGGNVGLVNRVTLLNNGNFGIATATPSALFTIGNNLFNVSSLGSVSVNTLSTSSALATLDVRGNSGTNAIASFSGQTTYAGLVVNQTGSGDIFTASLSAVNKFDITNAGLVGVGTSNPNAKEEIIAPSGNITNSETNTTNGFEISTGHTSSDYSLYMGGDSTNHVAYIQAANYSVGPANLILQGRGGSVSINTNLANATLDFGANAANNKIYVYDNGGTEKYGFGANNTNLEIYSGTGNNNTDPISFGHYDGTTYTEFARFQNNGLGIGTQALLAALDVRGNSGTTAIASFSGSTAFAGLVVNQTGSGDLITASSGGITKFTVANNGSITASGNLSIQGYATVSSSLALGYSTVPGGVGNADFAGQVSIGTNAATQALTIAGNESIFNASTGRGDLFASSTLDMSLLASGNVGIGTTAPAARLDVSGSQASSVSAFIRNMNTGATADGLAIQLGSTTPATTNYFAAFLDGNGDIIGKIQGNGSGGVTYATTGIDFAEYFKKAYTNEVLPPGTVVCQDTLGVTACSGPGKIVGVVSAQAGFAGGTQHSGDPDYVLVGLIGQLPVIVSSSSAAIVGGDALSVTSDGVVKAVTPGQVVGTAIQGSTDEANGEILVHVNVSWFDPSFTSNQNTALGANTSLEPTLQNVPLLDASNATISGDLTVLGRTVVNELDVTGNINAGLLAINGSASSIDSLGQPLKLQESGSAGIDILSGKIVISSNGDMTLQGNLIANVVTANKVNVSASATSTDSGVLGASAGSLTIPAGQTTITIQTNKLTPNSLIFITPDSPVAIGAKEIDQTTFKVSLTQTYSQDIHANWWIVN